MARPEGEPDLLKASHFYKFILRTTKTASKGHCTSAGLNCFSQARQDLLEKVLHADLGTL